jgi:hypothetical protein
MKAVDIEYAGRGKMQSGGLEIFLSNSCHGYFFINLFGMQKDGNFHFSIDIFLRFLSSGFLIF